MPALKKPTKCRVHGFVYCLDHGMVHEDTTDPFDYGRPDCRKSEHRLVYFGGRKGDYPEEEL